MAGSDRAGVACHRCHAKKVKCDATQDSSCSRCVAAGRDSECVLITSQRGKYECTLLTCDHHLMVGVDIQGSVASKVAPRLRLVGPSQGQHIQQRHNHPQQELLHLRQQQTSTREVRISTFKLLRVVSVSMHDLSSTMVTLCSLARHSAWPMSCMMSSPHFCALEDLYIAEGYTFPQLLLPLVAYWKEHRWSRRQALC